MTLVASGSSINADGLAHWCVHLPRPIYMKLINYLIRSIIDTIKLKNVRMTITNSKVVIVSPPFREMNLAHQRCS